MKIQELVNMFMDHVIMTELPLGIFNFYLHDDLLIVQIAEESDLGCWVLDTYGHDDCWGENLKSYKDICLFVRKILNYNEEFKKEFNL